MSRSISKSVSKSVSWTVFAGAILFAGSAAAETITLAKATKPAAAKSSKPAAEAAQPSKPAAESEAAPSSKPAADEKPSEGTKAETPPATPSEPAAAAAAVETPRADPATASAPPATPAKAPEFAPEPVKVQKKRTVEASGLNTQAVTIGGQADVGDTASEKDWGFHFKGYFRAPMRFGISDSGGLTPGELQFHAPPVTPDGNYTRWTYTNANPGPWAELLFQYGTQRVMMTTSIASYNITSGGWRELQDQLGIDRAFLTMKFPEALGDFGGVALDVGIFSNRYGAMGKYDAGQYETYLIGRTRNAGFTLTADLDLGDDFKLIFENGFGAKTDQQYQTYDCGSSTIQVTDTAGNSANVRGAGCPTLPNGYPKYSAEYNYPSWQPYAGDAGVQQGTNLLLHDHLGLVIKGIWTIQAHSILSFVRDARWNVASANGAGSRSSPNSPPLGIKDSAYIYVTGLDVKLDGGWMGDGYVGFSMVKAKNAAAVNDSIEVLHSQGGWQLAKNYFPNGNGTIYSGALQYTFSLAAMMMRPRPFWGQAADLTVRPFVMYNKVSGTDGGAYDMTKVKGGLDVVYSFIPNLAVALRLDNVRPDTKDGDKNFSVISPRLVFRSEFVTHESVVLQYSYYQYGSAYTDPARSASVMPDPFGKDGKLNISSTGLNMQPDKHVVMLHANMWW
jgi:hypothetical protein